MYGTILSCLARNIAVVFFFVTTSAACSAQQQSVEDVVFKETRLKILDDYLADNPENCNENRRRPDKVNDAYFNAAITRSTSEAAEIIINEIFCEAGFNGTVESNHIFLATLTAVNVSKLPDSEPVRNLHAALSIVATWETYPEVLNAWAYSELRERNLSVYGKNSPQSLGAVRGWHRSKVIASISDMAEILSAKNE